MSVNGLDLDLLQAFAAVAEELSFTRAADRLNRTQSAVSLQVKRLEARLGTTLFRRSTLRVSLTVTGSDFLTDARRILAISEQAIARVAGQRLNGRFRLGVMEDYGTRLLPPLLAEISERFPFLQIEMEIGPTSRLLKRLGASFNAVVAMHPSGASEGDLICRERAAWVTAPGHAAEMRNPLPVALSNPDCLFRVWAMAALNEAGLPWRLAYISPSLAAVEAIVERGLAVTVVKGSMISGRLEHVPAGLMPPLPGAEIRLHRAPNLNEKMALVVDQLTSRLRATALGS